MKVDYKDLGMRIKKRREEVKMSQSDLAAQVGLSTQHVSNVENARSKIGLEKLVAIANALNCSMDELLCGSQRVGSRSVFSDEIAGVIEEFSDVEMRILPEVLRLYNYAYKLLENNKDENNDR